MACSPRAELWGMRTPWAISALGRRGDAMELRSVDQQEHGASMAESGRPQTLPRAALAAQPGPRVPGQGAPYHEVVPASAAGRALSVETPALYGFIAI